jgi:hypothetical protein
MADFAKWASAAVWPFGYTAFDFLNAYEANRQELKKAALESSPASDVIAWFNKPQGFPKPKRLLRWQGTFGKLLDEVRNSFPLPVNITKTLTARGFSAEMMRAEPNLAEAGIKLNHLKREPGTGRRIFELVRTDAEVIAEIEATEQQEQWKEGQKARVVEGVPREQRVANFQAEITKWLKHRLFNKTRRNTILSAGHSHIPTFAREDIKVAAKALGVIETFVEGEGIYWELEQNLPN